jgi:hypothetical protein
MTLFKEMLCIAYLRFVGMRGCDPITMNHRSDLLYLPGIENFCRRAPWSTNSICKYPPPCGVNCISAGLEPFNLSIEQMQIKMKGGGEKEFFKAARKIPFIAEGLKKPGAKLYIVV